VILSRIAGDATKVGELDEAGPKAGSSSTFQHKEHKSVPEQIEVLKRIF